MSTINKTTFNFFFLLTIVYLDVADRIRCGHCVTHLGRVVVASHQKVLALNLLAMMAEPVATLGQL